MFREQSNKTNIQSNHWYRVVYALIARQFSQIYNIVIMVLAIDYHQNFVSAQYLENELMELDQILHMH